MSSKLYLVKVNFFLLSLSLVLTTNAQNPGQIPQPLVWLKADKFRADKGIWKDISGNHRDAKQISSGKLSADSTINFNKAIYFNGEGEFELAIPLKEKRNWLTAVMVYKTADSSTMGIFSCNGSKLLPLNFTTEQAKSATAQLTYNNTFIPHPLLGTVTQWCYSKDIGDNSTANGSDSITKVYIGKANNVDKKFKGLIAEFLLFDEKLSDRALSILHAYLAIKYGITLYNTSYFENDENLIWDFSKQYEYSYSVTGIGKQKEWDLDQPHSYNTTVLDSYLSLAIQKNKKNKEQNSNTFDQLKSNQFLLWGDNGKNLETDDTKGLMNRKWLISSIGFKHKRKPVTQLSFSARNLEKAKKIYLVIDKKNGSFSNTADLEYIKADSISQTGVAYFNNVIWDDDNSGTDYFSFSFGMKAKTSVQNATCSNGENGSCKLSIVGGKAPYNVSFKNTNADEQTTRSISQNEVEFSALKAGVYEYEVKDAASNIWKDKVEVTQAANLELPLQPSYFLTNNQPLKIQLETQGGYQYKWSNAFGFTAEGGNVTITKSGQYVLTATDKQGCSVSKPFTVLDSEGIGQNNTARLYPNPTTDGHFVVDIFLEEPTNVDVTIYNVLGEKMYHRRLLNHKSYSLTERLQNPGVYLIDIETKFGKQVFKLVVQ